MPFKRVWDSSCPRVYDRWEGDGASWVIQDLLPEDDETALRLLLDHFPTDEALCIASDMASDANSIYHMGNFWRVCLAKRMSLGCYVTKEGKTELVALNCCIVTCRDDDDELYPIKGDTWKNVYGGLSYVESKANAFDYLGEEKLLYALGLVVRRDYRGARLGARILAARKPLALAQGVKGSSTVFTGEASQKSAERAGFTEIARASMTELAEHGLRYPKDDNKFIKLMVKKYDS